jgi:hypothetical protein
VGQRGGTPYLNRKFYFEEPKRNSDFFLKFFFGCDEPIKLLIATQKKEKEKLV